MEDPVKKELIKGIAELFDDYEEAYVPGEWESFSQARRKKYPFLSSWIKIAALLLLLLSVLLFQQINFKAKTLMSVPVTKGNKNDQDNFMTDKTAEGSLKARSQQKHQARVPGNETGPSTASDVSSPLPKRLAQVRKYTSQPGNTIVSDVIEARVPEPALLAEKIKDPVVVIAGNPGRRPDSVVYKRSTADFLREESKTTKLAVINKKEEIDKWNFGVEVMPSMSKSNLNVGAGLTTAYRLSKNFSLSSGVSILQLQAGGTVSADPGMAGQQVKSSIAPKQLLAIDANISAIDIPIGLVYNVNKNFYTSVGVSYFNVIREKRNNTYLTPLGTPSASPVSSASAYQVLKSEAVEEPVTDKPLSGNSYLGFFNFSIGRQQEIFNGHKVLIEPFIKIPVGKLSSQDLQLMNSGIKFKLSF